MTNFVYMCRSVDIELSSAAILQYTRVGHVANKQNWTPFNYYNSVQNVDWLLPAVDSAGVVS